VKLRHINHSGLVFPRHGVYEHLKQCFSANAHKYKYNNYSLQRTVSFKYLTWFIVIPHGV